MDSETASGPWYRHIWSVALSHVSITKVLGAPETGSSGTTRRPAVALVPGLVGHPLGEIDWFLSQSNAPAVRTRTEDKTPELSWFVNDFEKAKTLAGLQNKQLLIDFPGIPVITIGGRNP
jgi:hypothetical protein